MYITYIGQLKRLDAVCRSPIYSHFDETIVGASSIRAYRKEGEFIAKCERLIDESQRPFYLIVVAQRWLGVWMEVIGALIVFFAALFAVLNRDNLSPGMVGLSITYALQVNIITCILATCFNIGLMCNQIKEFMIVSLMQVVVMMNSLIRCSAELETHMVAVERIDEYTKIPSEVHSIIYFIDIYFN